MNQYEAMFIFDPSFATKFSNAEREVSRIMERASATDVTTQKWDDRRLAYRIAGRKRGVYALVYFKAAPDHIAGIEHDAKLSAHVLRVLVVRADYVSQDQVDESRKAAVQSAARDADERDSRPGASGRQASAALAGADADASGK